MKQGKTSKLKLKKTSEESPKQDVTTFTKKLIDSLLLSSNNVNHFAISVSKIMLEPLFLEPNVKLSGKLL